MMKKEYIINNIPFSKSERKGLKYGRYMRPNMNTKGCIDNAYKVTIKKIWQ